MPDVTFTERSILVVEDNALLRGLLASMVSALGYTPSEARSGEEAIAILREGEAISTLITDILMPGGMTGLALADIVGVEFPRTKIVVMSGLDEPPCLPSNISYLPKPFTAKDLRHALAKDESNILGSKQATG
jgi:CheY-like chemotaxis protein